MTGHHSTKSSHVFSELLEFPSVTQILVFLQSMVRAGSLRLPTTLARLLATAPISSRASRELPRAAAGQATAAPSPTSGRMPRTAGPVATSAQQTSLSVFLESAPSQ